MTCKVSKFFCILFTAMLFLQPPALAYPGDFVALPEIDKTIIVEMRYATQHNFVGKPLPGYHANQCLLTKATALKLKEIQSLLRASRLSLKVYDCYRPTAAVQAFIAWSASPRDQRMKAEFYPLVDKKDVFKLGFVAERSGHSRGSTVDLTIVPLPVQPQPAFKLGEKLHACFNTADERFADNSLDMGTGYDCFDARSHPENPNINVVAKHNRALLRELMLSHGFLPSETEWWHFTLKSEPHPTSYFNFAVR